MTIWMKRVSLAVALAATGQVRATVLVSNIGEPVRSTTSISSALWAAQSFVNDGNVWALSNIRTVLGGGLGAPKVVAELRKGTTSGALITNFTISAVSGAQTARTLLPQSAVTLSAGETYWLVLGVVGNGSFGFSYAEGNNQTGTGAIGGYRYSMDQGSNWGNVGSDNPYLIEVNVAPSAAVPEPLSWAMMLAGFGVIGGVMRHRRQSRTYLRTVAKVGADGRVQLLVTNLRAGRSVDTDRD